MGRRGSRATGGGDGAKRKKITVTPIARGPDGGPEPYGILDHLIAEVRQDLVGVKIALAWKRGWTIDPDGLLKAGKCCKPAEVHRQLMDFDIVILLNEDLWPLLKPKQREELVLHEMTHVAVVLDKTGEVKRDDRGRTVVRIRKHDIEEFRVVRSRYGQDNLRSVGASVLSKSKEPLLSHREA